MGNLKKYEQSPQLFNYETMADGITGEYLNADGTTSNDSRFSITDYIPCNSMSVTLYRGTQNNIPAICGYDENKIYITGISYSANDPVTLTTIGQNFKYIRFSWKNETHSDPDDLAHTMLNAGTVSLPYEPYGKIWRDLQPKIYNNSVWSDSSNNPKKYNGGWT